MKKNLQKKVTYMGASQMALVVKDLPVNAGDFRDVGLIPGSGRFPGGGHGSPLQYSCLENPMDRRTWRAMLHRVAKSRTKLKWLNIHAHIYIFVYIYKYLSLSFSCGSVVKNLPANVEDGSLVPVLRRSREEGNGNPLQYSCLENPMDRGA